MASDSPTNAQKVAEPALLERARLALQSLQFEEEAARYRAACAELIEAIADAESGDKEPLKRWLDTRRLSRDGNNAVSPSSPQTQSTQPRGWVADRGSVEDNVSSESGADGVNPAVALDPDQPQVASPWIRMQNAALERAPCWLAEDDGIEHVHDLPENVTPLDLVIAAGTKQAAGGRKPRRRWLPPHVVGSAIVHGLFLLMLAWWVVANVQPRTQLSLTAGPTEPDEMALETTIDATPVDSETVSESEPAPIAEIENLPLEIPQIASIDIGIGPRLAESTLAATVGSLAEIGGAGTNLAAGVAFFGAQAAGNNFVFVVDCSPSMARDSAFESAKNELLRSLSMLKPKQRYFILFFGKEVVPIQFPGKEPESYLLQANSENLEKTVQWIQRGAIQKEGRHPVDAMRQAMALRPDGIFLLFDGDTKVDAWTDNIRSENRTDDLFASGEVEVPIHVVHFFREEFAPQMKRLAEENGGTYRFVPRPPKGPPR